jgi:K+-transporting ATPase ATPase C chain
MLREIRQGILFTLVTMALFGGAYPLAVRALGAAVFRGQAEGSLVRDAGGTILGSRLLAQKFTRDEYFQPRPSAVESDASAAGGSNLGPSNPDHLEAVRRRVDAIRLQEHAGDDLVPVEMVTASGSGLDPDIPPAAAELQAARVAFARGVPIERVRALIEDRVEPPWLGLFGRSRVNVLDLNLALDAAFGAPDDHTESGR